MFGERWVAGFLLYFLLPMTPSPLLQKILLLSLLKNSAVFGRRKYSRWKWKEGKYRHYPFAHNIGVRELFCQVLSVLKCIVTLSWMNLKSSKGENTADGNERKENKCTIPWRTTLISGSCTQSPSYREGRLTDSLKSGLIPPLFITPPDLELWKCWYEWRYTCVFLKYRRTFIWQDSESQWAGTASKWWAACYTENLRKVITFTLFSRQLFFCLTCEPPMPASVMQGIMFLGVSVQS